MTIKVELKHRVQVALERQAAAHGRNVEAYAASLLESALSLPETAAKPSPDRLDAVLSEIAQFSHQIPSLPNAAFTRESIYRDHD